jgi:voltage-gated sodium channel
MPKQNSSKDKEIETHWLERFTNEHKKGTDLHPFSIFILFLIILSALLVGYETYLISSGAENYKKYLECRDTFEYIDTFILIIFIMEVAIRIYASKKEIDTGNENKVSFSYFQDHWNKLDFGIVSISVVFYIIHHTINSNPNGFDSSFMLVVLRTLRIYRVVTHSQHLEELIDTAFESLKKTSYVILMLGVLFYIYAIIGVNFYGHLNQNRFGNLNKAGSNLFQIMTGNLYISDNIKEIEDSLCQVSSTSHKNILESRIEQCTKVHFKSSFDQYFNITLPLYIISFFFVGGLVVLNLIIGIIITELQDAKIKNLKKEIDIKALEGNLEIFEHMRILEEHITKLSKKMKNGK